MVVLEAATSAGGTHAPIARAEVCVIASRTADLRGVISGTPVEITNARGVAQFGGLPSGPIRVIARKPGYIGQEKHFRGRPTQVGFQLALGSGGPSCPRIPPAAPPGGGAPGGGGSLVPAPSSPAPGVVPR